MTDAERAYAAGFFDGEGTVHVGPKKVQVVFTNTNLTLLRWLQVRWGGGIYKQTPHGLAGTLHQVYQLHVSALHLQTAILRELEPFLVAKTPLVQNALVFLDLQRRWHNKRTPATVRNELARLAQRHKELRGLIAEAEPPDVKESEQLDVFSVSNNETI